MVSNNPPKKLLMITGLGSAKDLASGKKGAFYNTLEEFHQYWERIDIIAPKIKGQPSGVKKVFSNVYLHISSWPLIFHPIFFLKKGYEIYREQKFNLMTVQEFPPFYNGIGARLLWKKIKVPYLLEIHHIPGCPKASNLKEKIYQKLTKFFIRNDAKKALAIRVVNANQVPDFLKNAGVPEEKIKYIPSLYIDLEIFKPLGLEKKYDLIFLGRLVENKGINLFLETVKKTKLRAIIVGDGDRKIEDHIESENNRNNLGVIRIKAKDAVEVAELLNQSKILAMPSYNEGGPRVAAESLACGVPVLATPVGLMPDFAKEGAVTIVDWDADDMALKAKELLSNQALYEQCRQAGLVLVQKFEKKSAIKNYAEQLYEIINRHSKSR